MKKTKQRKVDEEDEEDNGDITLGPDEFYETEIRFTYMLMTLHGSGNRSEQLEIHFCYNCLIAKAPCWDDLLLLTMDNICSPKFRYYTRAVLVKFMDAIVAIPPFMTVALMHANTSESTVLCLAAVEAIKHVVENEADNKEDNQRMLRQLIYSIIPQWLFHSPTEELGKC